MAFQPRKLTPGAALASRKNMPSAARLAERTAATERLVQHGVPYYVLNGETLASGGQKMLGPYPVTVDDQDFDVVVLTPNQAKFYLDQGMLSVTKPEDDTEKRKAATPATMAPTPKAEALPKTSDAPKVAARPLDKA